MNDVQLVEVLDASDNLVEERAGLGLFHAVALHDVVEQLTSFSELHYQVQLLGGLNDFVQLDDVGMPNDLEDMNLSSDSFDVVDIDDLVFLQNLYGDLLACQVVDSKFNLTEGALADGLAQDVLADIVHWS